MLHAALVSGEADQLEGGYSIGTVSEQGEELC